MASAASVERLVPMMAFCEAPFNGTLDGTSSAPSSSPSAGGSSASGNGAATSKPNPFATRRPVTGVKRLVPMMAFCEAPFDGTLDGTSSSAPPARGSSSASGDDAATRRRELNMQIAKAFRQMKSQRREQAPRETVVVDGLAIFETIAL